MLLFMDGFEGEGNITQWWTINRNDYHGSNHTYYSLDAVNKRTGSYGLKIYNYDTTVDAPYKAAYITADIVAPNTRNTLYVGTGIRTFNRDGIGVQPYYSLNSEGIIFIGRNDATSCQIRLSFDSNGRIRAYSTKTSGFIGTGTHAMTNNTWYYWQIKMVADATNGIFQFYIGNHLELDLTGLNTSTIGNIVDWVSIRCQFNGANNNPGFHVYIDDFVMMNDDGTVNNTFPIGTPKIIGTRPSADGDVNDMTASTGNRWDCVDEQTGSGTDYVLADLTNKKNLFNFTDVTALYLSAYRGLQVTTCVARSDTSGQMTGDVRCRPKCLSNFNDIRFTKADGTTLLDYWIESTTGTTPNQVATIWVEFDQIDTTATTFYMYYGKADASAVSDGNNTFILFDHFDGTALDTSKWTAINTGTGSRSFASSIMTQAATAAGGEWKIIPQTNSFGRVAVEALIKASNARRSFESIGIIKDANNEAETHYETSPSSQQNSSQLLAGSWSESTLESGGSAVQRIVSVTNGGSTSKAYLYDITRVSKGSKSQSIDLGNTVSLTSIGSRQVSSSCTCDIDQIFIRQYLDTGPTQGSWGEPEDSTILSGQTNRRKITLSCASAVTNYQMMVNVIESEGGVSRYNLVYRDATDQEDETLNQLFSSTSQVWHTFIYEKSPISGANQTGQEIVDMQQGFKTTQI